MKQFFRDHFSFNQVEIKGIRVLLVVLVILISVYFMMPVLMGSKQKLDSSKYQAAVDSFMASAIVDTSYFDEKNSDNNYYDQKNKKYWSDNSKNEFMMKPFDPNGLPVEVWVQMGLSEKQANVIKNYELKGGKFKTKEDVKKQFVISADFYKKIEPYIIFAEINDEVNSEHTPLSVDINHATKEDLILLKGVKDYLAEGIIKYRQRLGGFTTVDQLKEVKYLSERIFADITPHCFITSYSVKKININLAEWTELAPHPYIGGDLATSIINHRKKHGIFKNADDFRKAGLVDEVLYAKLVPYLNFSH